MPNTSHILETALLILVAFLIGAIVGTIARRLTLRKAKPVEQPAAADTAPAGPQLVTAPTIAPVSGSTPRRSAAERLAAAAGRDIADGGALQPSRTAGDATAGVVVPPPAPILAAPPAADPAPVAEAKTGSAAAETPSAVSDSVGATQAPKDAAPVAEPAAPESPATPPEPVQPTRTKAADADQQSDVIIVPPVVPEPESKPVVASEVPPIDEAAQVVEREIADGAPEPKVDATPAPEADRKSKDKDRPKPEPEPVAEQSIADEVPVAGMPPSGPSEPPTAPAADIDEDAAMRAIESGDWQPRRVAPTRPVPHPEQVGPQDVDAAMASARSAVAAATKAAAAAIAENEELARERRAAAAVLDFEAAAVASPPAFLDTHPAVDEVIETSGLAFEVRPRAFGQPEGLSGPRDGFADNLKQIKGVTPALESALNALGIYHFDQIAAWDQKGSVWIDNHLTLKGRLVKDKWVEQAADLSHGRSHVARPVRP